MSELSTKLLILAAIVMLGISGSAPAAPQYTAVDLAVSPGQLGLRGGAFVDSIGPVQAGGRGFLWRGSAASAVDLTPAGATGALIYGAYSTALGGEEVGRFFDAQFKVHAGLWQGTAAS